MDHPLGYAMDTIPATICRCPLHEQSWRLLVEDERRVRVPFRSMWAAGVIQEHQLVTLAILVAVSSGSAPFVRLGAIDLPSTVLVLCLAAAGPSIGSGGVPFSRPQ